MPTPEQRRKLWFIAACGGGGKVDAVTMKAQAVNLGNRTGDVLQVERLGADGVPLETNTVRRGDRIDVEAHYDKGSVYRFTAVPGADDQWAGNPQVVVVDAPRGSKET